MWDLLIDRHWDWQLSEPSHFPLPLIISPKCSPVIRNGYSRRPCNGGAKGRGFSVLLQLKNRQILKTDPVLTYWLQLSLHIIALICLIPVAVCSIGHT
jgi:hypothetical protein